MKRWSYPELTQIGIANTEATECEFNTVYGGNGTTVQHHYCHLNQSHNHSSEQHNGDASIGRKHWISEGCTDGHDYCRCFGLS